MDIPSVGCIVDTDFHDKLLVSTIFPTSLLALLGLTFTMIWQIVKIRSRKKLSRKFVRGTYTSLILLVGLFLDIFVSFIDNFPSISM